GDPVYNRIVFIMSGKKDIWMMNQSHHGVKASKGSWDRLAIVVDKSSSPKTARFLQLPAGPLEWSEDLPLKRLPLKISCFLCHSNGPRAIRFNEANGVSLSWRDKLTVGIWNLQIKTYGRVIADSTHDKEDPELAVPFRYRGHYENETLEVKACVKCHQDAGIVARGKLTRLNGDSIRLMVASGEMPPAGFSLSESERQEIKNFVEGF
ncbi:MAG TPA: hypothetical protein VM432_11530, partial [Bdellovibrionales bacterium]|nr:hypothetical protein [Bdellovibrionales bacterium]